MKAMSMFAGVVAAMAMANSACAEGPQIVSRSLENAQADLVRDWNFKGGGTPIPVRRRTRLEMQADLVRDWNGPSKEAVATRERDILRSRATQDSYDDLMRNWRG